LYTKASTKLNNRRNYEVQGWKFEGTVIEFELRVFLYRRKYSI